MDAKDIPAGPAREAALWLEQRFPDRYGSPEVRHLRWLQRQLRKLQRQVRGQESDRDSAGIESGFEPAQLRNHIRMASPEIGPVEPDGFVGREKPAVVVQHQQVVLGDLPILVDSSIPSMAFSTSARYASV
jgi:hypothetical protein